MAENNQPWSILAKRKDHSKELSVNRKHSSAFRATQPFYEKVRCLPVHELAQHLNLSLSRQKRFAGPCPACGSNVRSKSKKDHRLPIGFRSDRRGWECQHCHEKGDGLDLVSFTLEGGKYKSLSPQRQSRVREWYDQQGFTDDLGARGDSVTRKQACQVWVPPTSKGHVVAEVQQRRYIPEQELIEVWNSCLPVDEDQEAVRMLESWKAAPGAVAFYDLARVLPKDMKPYPWMIAGGKPWNVGWRLLIPAFDHEGKMRSLKARWLRATNENGHLKSASPKGYAIGGVVAANGYAQDLLREGQLPGNGSGGNNRFDIWIVEGEKDLIALAGRTGDTYRAVFGIWQGAWTEQIASRIPREDCIRIILATDPGEQGEKYKSKVLKSLVHRGLKHSQIKEMS